MKGQERVKAALRGAGLDIHLVRLSESARTAQLAADALNTPLGSIVKSLVFLADGKHRYVVNPDCRHQYREIPLGGENRY